MSTLPSLLLLLSLYCEAFNYGCGFVGGVAATEINDSIKQSAEHLVGAFPFYMFTTFAAKLVFSLVVGCIVIRYLLLVASPKVSKAVVSHILLKDSSEQGRKKLEEIKREIQNDKSKFALAAQLHSDCPSGKAKEGLLGSLSPGQTVPPFDRVVFDPTAEVGVVLGPIQTHFGWHLIMIHTRNTVTSSY